MEKVAGDKLYHLSTKSFKYCQLPIAWFCSHALSISGICLISWPNLETNIGSLV